MGLCGSVQQDGPDERRQQLPRRRVAPQDTPWDKTFPAMTRGQLNMRRREFWESRREGRPEMWAAIKLASTAVDAATAEIILTGAGLRPYDIDCPDACHTYDELGNRYEVPMFVLHDPRNLILVEEECPLSEEEQKMLDTDVRFTIRLSTGHDMVLETQGAATIGDIKEHVAEEKELDVKCLLVLFQGRMLDDRMTLIRAGVRDSTIMQMMVRKQPKPEPAEPPA